VEPLNIDTSDRFDPKVAELGNDRAPDHGTIIADRDRPLVKLGVLFEVPLSEFGDERRSAHSLALSERDATHGIYHVRYLFAITGEFSPRVWIYMKEKWHRRNYAVKTQLYIASLVDYCVYTCFTCVYSR
jgi:hypothetical protein